MILKLCKKILTMACCAGLFFLLLPALTYAELAQLTDMQIISVNTGARIICTLTQPTLYHLFTLDHPNRLVLDLKGAQLATRIPVGAIENNNIHQLRTGHPIPTVLRLVFDLQSKVRYKISADNKQIVIDIAALPLSNSHPPHHEMPSNKPVRFQEKSFVAKNAPQDGKKKTHLTIVVIDAGHGGKDTGAIGPDGTREKDVVLSIAKCLAALINRQPKMHAELTRHGDYFLTLRERLSIARDKKADIFIAVHADSFFDNRSMGVSIYTLSKRGVTSEAARWIANRENNSELGGVDLSELGDQSHVVRSVLIDLAQTATIRDSLRLGTHLLHSLDAITTLHTRCVEQAPFVVLKSPDIPSVLVETGFISNPQEAMRLKDARYQARLAAALFKGIQTYVAKY